MSVYGVGNANSYLYKNLNGSSERKKGGVFFKQAAGMAVSDAYGVSGQNGRFSAKDAYNSMSMNGMRIRSRSEIGECYLQNSHCKNTNLLAQVKGGVQKVDNGRYLIDVSDEIEGYWKIYDKERDESFTFDPFSTSVQTDENTGKDYIVSCDPRGGLMSVMYADNALTEDLKTFLHTDNITKPVLNDRYSIEVHAYTGIECLKVKGKEGSGSWIFMDKNNQEQMDKLQDLANLYKEKYPNLVKDDDLAMKFYAQGEVAGHIVRTGNGIMIIACNGMQYMDNNDPSKNWGFTYSENNTDIYNEIMKAIIEGSIRGGIEAVSGWEEWFQENAVCADDR